MHIKKAFCALFASAVVCAAANAQQTVTISKQTLADKNRGGWAGQVVGCKYGAPTEFKYMWTPIPSDVKILWDEDKPVVKDFYDGVYDDLYVNIVFMDIFKRLGFDAPRSEFRKAIALASFPVWEGNFEARCAWFDNFKVEEPVSWKTNVSANAIDFEIEADYAGLMSPALPNMAVKFCETPGRAIAGGEAFYCGAFVAAMYSNAYYMDNIVEVVKASMAVLPRESELYAIIEQLLEEHQKDPYNWVKAWYANFSKFRKNHDENFATRFNLYSPFNCAYIVMGLLYGNGDFERTMEISTRCGLDSDCNPCNACGILGTMLGYSKIPSKYTRPIEMAPKAIFQGTTYTFDAVCEESLAQAKKVLKLAGAKETAEGYTITLEPTKRMAFEEPMPPSTVLKKQEAQKVSADLGKPAKVEIEGSGVNVVFAGDYKKYIERENWKRDLKPLEMAASFEVYIDGRLERTANLFFASGMIRDSICLNLDLPAGKHTVEIRLVKDILNIQKPATFDVHPYVRVK